MCQNKYTKSGRKLYLHEQYMLADEMQEEEGKSESRKDGKSASQKVGKKCFLKVPCHISY